MQEKKKKHSSDIGVRSPKIQKLFWRKSANSIVPRVCGNYDITSTVSEEEAAAVRASANGAGHSYSSYPVALRTHAHAPYPATRELLSWLCATLTVATRAIYLCCCVRLDRGGSTIKVYPFLAKMVSE